jgi:hypothetical protein
VLADDVEAMTGIGHQLWKKIRQDLWGERWNFWRKL